MKPLTEGRGIPYQTKLTLHQPGLRTLRPAQPYSRKYYKSHCNIPIIIQFTIKYQVDTLLFYSVSSKQKATSQKDRKKERTCRIGRGGRAVTCTMNYNEQLAHKQWMFNYSNYSILQFFNNTLVRDLIILYYESMFFLNVFYTK